MRKFTGVVQKPFMVSQIIDCVCLLAESNKEFWSTSYNKNYPLGSEYSDLQLTVSNTAANATTTTTTYLFTMAPTFHGQFNHYSKSDFYQDIRNLKIHHYLCAPYTSPTAHFCTEGSDL